MPRRQTARHATNLWCLQTAKSARVLSERIERDTDNVALACQRVDDNVSIVEFPCTEPAAWRCWSPAATCATHAAVAVPSPLPLTFNCITVSMESVSLPKVSVLHTSLEFKANLVIVSLSAGGSSLLVLLAVLCFSSVKVENDCGHMGNDILPRHSLLRHSRLLNPLNFAR